ncbi:MAG: CDP-alcohol phosphatidyltransferase family protein [Coraliomargarita sp.]
MTSIYDLKSRFQDLLRPAVRLIESKGVTANQVTVFAFMLSVVTAVLLAIAPESRLPYFIYPLFLFIRMALNAIDGMLAREFGQQSHLGAILNELGDIFSDAALYLALGFISGASMMLAATFTTLAIATEVTGLITANIGASRRYDGPMGKSDRAFAIGAFMFFAGIWPQVTEWLNALLVVLCLLCLGTVINRIKKALREL